MAGAPDRGLLIALASLESVGPARLTFLLEGRSAEEAWTMVRSGSLPAGPIPASLGQAWRVQSAGLDPTELAARHDDAGVLVTTPDHPDLQARFVGDPSPPPLLLVQGDPAVVSLPSVAIIGTRDCTSYGRQLARTWGHELAEAGVSVVSGLALGIDGAAHLGSIRADAAPPIGVVGSGLDVVYPHDHRTLWQEVAARGVLITEHPLGTRPKPWHFPARNRLLAALADVVVVIESHGKGGSLHTVEEAVARDTEVLAVPGSVRSAASEGTNRLLFDGCGMARGTDDILLVLARAVGYAICRPDDEAGRERGPSRPAPTDVGRRLLEALGWEPASTDQLILRSCLPFGEAAAALGDLERDGWVELRGGWYERVGGDRGAR